VTTTDQHAPASSSVVERYLKHESSTKDFLLTQVVVGLRRYTTNDASDYNTAFQSWDWRRLPGITADVDSPMLPCNYSAVLQQDSEQMLLTGTVSDGSAGAENDLVEPFCTDDDDFTKPGSGQT
jgi:hypothetical protein